MEAVETKRRIPRKRVRLVKVTVDGAEVDGKECTKCGVVKALTEYHVSSLGIGARRSICRGCMNKKGNCARPKYRTPEAYNDEVSEVTKGEYTVLAAFISTTKEIPHRHNTCGYIWNVRPHNILNGTGCPICAGNVKKTHEEYLYEIRQKFGDEFSVLSTYETARKPVSLRHNMCGYIWEVMPSGLLSKGSWCPRCSASRLSDLYRKTQEDYVNEVAARIGDAYEVLGKYRGSFEPILHRHNVCGNEWFARPNNFLKGSRCPPCSLAEKGKNKRRNPDDYIRLVEELVGDEYFVVGKYTTSDDHITHRHNKCGFEWDVVPYSFLRGTRCPRCIGSKGENRVEEVLVSLNVPYKRQFRTDDCADQRPLPFDFAVRPTSGLVLIEFDGRQHFEAIELWGGDIELELTQYRDRIKTEYCAANGIPLIRIPYTQFDEIETILTHKLTKLGVIGKRQSKRKRTRKESEVTA